MTGDEIRAIRGRLRLTPAQLGDLLGAAASSVYRWEAAGAREVAIDPFPLRILTLLRDQLAAADAQRANDVADGVARGLLIGGGLLGLFHLLGHVFGDERVKPRRNEGTVARPIRGRARSSTRRRR